MVGGCTGGCRRGTEESQFRGFECGTNGHGKDWGASLTACIRRTFDHDFLYFLSIFFAGGTELMIFSNLYVYLIQ